MTGTCSQTCEIRCERVKSPFHRPEGEATVSASTQAPQLRNCVKVEVAVPGLSLSLIVLVASVDVKQH